MRSPDHTDAQRIDALLAGAPPESEREAQLEGLIRQLRAAATPAPPIVRERVRTLREPERRHWSWKPALVALSIAAALAAGVFGLSRSGSDEGASSAEGGGAEALTTPFATQDSRRDARALAPPVSESEAAQLDATDSAAGRAQEWDVALELRVRDNDRLSEASADAIRTTRELGGFVVSSNVSTRAQNGEARLVLRVPSRRIQDAIARLSELGTITAQSVQIQDRQDELDRLRRRIDELRVQRAEVNLRLQTEQLTPPERLRLELQRQRLTGRLNSLTATRNGVAREVAMAEVSLTVRTGKSSSVPTEGRLEGAAGEALHVLAVAGAAAIFVLIVISPLLLIGLAVWLGRRALRRREHERLLDQTKPAAARD
jgi:Domain of unknown function (DUF4349)